MTTAAKKTRGSPAPWFVDRRADGDVNVIDILAIDPVGGVFVVCSVLADKKISDVERADAANISAVPELIALAEHVVRYFRRGPIRSELDSISLLRAANAVLAKVATMTQSVRQR